MAEQGIEDGVVSEESIETGSSTGGLCPQIDMAGAGLEEATQHNLVHSEGPGVYKAAYLGVQDGDPDSGGSGKRGGLSLNGRRISSASA